MNSFSPEIQIYICYYFSTSSGHPQSLRLVKFVIILEQQPTVKINPLKVNVHVITICDQTLLTKGEEFEAKSITSKFSMDTIASCAFGVDAKVHEGKGSVFVQSAEKMFEETFAFMMKFLLGGLIPYGSYVLKALGLSVWPKKETLFFYDTILNTLNKRRELNIRRNDLIDMMMDAVKGDLVEDKDGDEDQYHNDAKLSHKVSKELDEMSIVSTALVILIAGYDTTATTLAFACYQLAKHPQVQDRLREEIDRIVDDADNISYEDLHSMSYMDQVISEVLRFHTLAGIHQVWPLHNALLIFLT